MKLYYFNVKFIYLIYIVRLKDFTWTFNDEIIQLVKKCAPFTVLLWKLTCTELGGIVTIIFNALTNPLNFFQLSNLLFRGDPRTKCQICPENWKDSRHRPIKVFANSKHKLICTITRALCRFFSYQKKKTKKKRKTQRDERKNKTLRGETDKNWRVFYSSSVKAWNEL